MQKIILLILTAFNFMLAGACIAAGYLEHISIEDSVILTFFAVFLAAFGAVEYNTGEDN